MIPAADRESMMHLLRALAATLGILAFGLPATAQEADRAVPPVSVASDHWVYPLLDRMAADGLLDGVWMPGRRPVGAGAIAAALDTAAARAGEASPWTETLRAAAAWLQQEYGVSSAAGFRVLPSAGARIADGPLADPSSLMVGFRLLYRPSANLGFWADPVLELGEPGLEAPYPRLGGAWSPGPFRFSAGYGPKRLGPGASGGIVLHDRAELPWVEMALDEPVVLPWLFRHLGSIQVSVAASRIGADSLSSTVGFFTNAIRVQPLPWFTAGLYRSALVASEVDGEKLTFGHVLKMLQGSRAGLPANFDDQKASMSGSLRFDLFGVTLNPYFVWAWEDTWEIDEDPGTILGVWASAIAVGELPVGVRYEYTAFGEDAQIIWPWHDVWQWRNWYRHGSIRRAYVDGDGELLGHPLGGYGSEHRVEVDIPVAGRRLLIRATLYHRERIEGTSFYVNRPPYRTIEYSNLLYDEMPGRSVGGEVRVARLAAPLRLKGEVGLEVAEDGWTRAVGSLWATWLLP